MSKIKAKNTLYNDPRYDVVVDSRMLEQHLKEKDQQIAELEQQLEEKEKEIRQLDNEKGMLLNNSMKLLKEKDDKLHSQPAEIVEKIKDLAGDYFYENGDDVALTGNDFAEILENVLKEYGE